MCSISIWVVVVIDVFELPPEQQLQSTLVTIGNVPVQMIGIGIVLKRGLVRVDVQIQPAYIIDL